MWNGTSRRGRRMSFEFPPGGPRHPSAPGNPMAMAGRHPVPPTSLSSPPTSSPNGPHHHHHQLSTVDAASLLRMSRPPFFGQAGAANGRRFLDSVNPYFPIPPHSQFGPFNHFHAGHFNGLHGKVLVPTSVFQTIIKPHVQTSLLQASNRIKLLLLLDYYIYGTHPESFSLERFYLSGSRDHHRGSFFGIALDRGSLGPRHSFLSFTGKNRNKRTRNTSPNASFLY